MGDTQCDHVVIGCRSDGSCFSADDAHRCVAIRIASQRALDRLDVTVEAEFNAKPGTNQMCWRNLQVEGVTEGFDFLLDLDFLKTLKTVPQRTEYWYRAGQRNIPVDARGLQQWEEQLFERFLSTWRLFSLEEATKSFAHGAKIMYLPYSGGTDTLLDVNFYKSNSIAYKRKFASMTDLWRHCGFQRQLPCLVNSTKNCKACKQFNETDEYYETQKGTNHIHFIAEEPTGSLQDLFDVTSELRARLAFVRQILSNLQQLEKQQSRYHANINADTCVYYAPSDFRPTMELRITNIPDNLVSTTATTYDVTDIKFRNLCSKRTPSDLHCFAAVVLLLTALDTPADRRGKQILHAVQKFAFTEVSKLPLWGEAFVNQQLKTRPANSTLERNVLHLVGQLWTTDKQKPSSLNACDAIDTILRMPDSIIPQENVAKSSLGLRNVMVIKIRPPQSIIETHKTKVIRQIAQSVFPDDELPITYKFVRRWEPDSLSKNNLQDEGMFEIHERFDLVILQDCDEITTMTTFEGVQYFMQPWAQLMVVAFDKDQKLGFKTISTSEIRLHLFMNDFTSDDSRTKTGVLAFRQISPQQLNGLRAAMEKKANMILKEIKKRPFVKRKHWIWWVFPCETQGQSDNTYKSAVPTLASAIRLMNQQDHMDKWIDILEKLTDALEDQSKSIAFPIHFDVLRIDRFLQLWQGDYKRATQTNESFQRAVSEFAATWNSLK